VWAAMNGNSQHLSIDSFASVPGDIECGAQSIPGFEELWRALVPGADFATMGCETFRKMSTSIEDYVIACINQTLEQHGTTPTEVDHIVFSMTDATLGLVGPDFVTDVLKATAMIHCIPAVISYQQCCSSLTALQYGWQLFAADATNHVVVVAFDFRSDDRDRVRPFALFGDAVTSCMISRRAGSGLRLAGASIGMDFHGLIGEDSFSSRQTVARAALHTASEEAGVQLDTITRVFPSNLFKPLTLFNLSVAGIDKAKLHFDTTFRRFGHCGNPDWMMNLVDYRETVGIKEGDVFLALASAPGFFACNLLLAQGTAGGNGGG
jgi:3-oxoacyl-[acyl-carrier-protein] synthase III